MDVIIELILSICKYNFVVEPAWKWSEKAAG
jgi:hypothetical protein